MSRAPLWDERRVAAHLEHRRTTMWNKALIGGVVGVALLGTGGFALASANGATQAAVSTPQLASTATAGTKAAPASPDAKKHHPKKDALQGHLKGVQHGEGVTKDKTGAFVTRVAIQGDVTALSATSITVKAQDGVSMTFAVTADTKVRVRAADKAADKAAQKAKGSDAKITDVKSGQHVVVSGTGKGSLTADHVVAQG